MTKRMRPDDMTDNPLSRMLGRESYLLQGEVAPVHFLEERVSFHLTKINKKIKKNQSMRAVLTPIFRRPDHQNDGNI